MDNGEFQYDELKNVDSDPDNDRSSDGEDDEGALKSQRHPIRLLRVLPAETISSCLTCELITGDVTSGYTALSYVWGNPEPNCSLILRSASSCRPLSIHQKLFDFLLEVRRRVDESLIWVDAIYINQQNVSERNKQVRQMSSIYRSAARVIVWINDSHITHLFQAIQDNHDDFMQSHQERKNGDGSLSEWFDDWSWMLNPMRRGLRHFYQHEYWLRVWIRQEFMLAADVVFWSGNEYLDLAAIELLTRYFYLSEGIDRESRFQRRYGLVDNMFRLRIFQQESGERDMHKLAYFMQRYGRCSDIRDHVYVVLSLVEDGAFFNVDYNFTLYDLFCEVCDFFTRGEDRSGELAPNILQVLEIDAKDIFEQLEFSDWPLTEQVTINGVDR